MDFIPEKLAFLKNLIFENDPWETYMIFLSALGEPGSYSEYLLPFVNQEKLSPSILIPPGNPEELFGDQGKSGDFTQEKIDYLYKETKKITDIINSLSNSLGTLRKYAVILFVGWVVLKIINHL